MRPIPYSANAQARLEARSLRLIALDAQHKADARGLRFGFFLTLALDFALALTIICAIYGR